MALSMKNTIVSLSLSGVMLFAGFLTGEQPVRYSSATHAAPASPIAGIKQVSGIQSHESSKKAKRSFAAPYFSFGKSAFAQGAKQ